MLVQDAITEMLMTGMKCTQTWTETDIRSRKKKVSETLKTKHQNDYSYRTNRRMAGEPHQIVHSR